MGKVYGTNRQANRYRKEFSTGRHLLSYPRLGESKNESLGKDINWSIEIPSDEHMNELKAIVESHGLPAQVGG